MTFNDVFTNDYRKFALRLVKSGYSLGESDALSTNLVFSSEWINPRLHLIDNYFFKVNYLSNILANEIRKHGFPITQSTIKSRVIRPKVTAYHAICPDDASGRDVDFIFFIDTKSFKAFVFKRDPELASNQKKFYGTEKKVLKAAEVSIDKFFQNAFNFFGTVKSSSEVIKESDIIKIVRTERAFLEILLAETGEKIDYVYDKTETALDLQKANEYIVKIISNKKPIIDSKILFKIRNKEKELFKIPAEIVRERSIKHKEFYELNMAIGFYKEENIDGAKALLVYLKNLKENKGFNMPT